MNILKHLFDSILPWPVPGFLRVRALGDQATIVFNPLHDGDFGGRLISISVNGKPIGGEELE